MQIQNKNDIEYNEHVSDSNDNTTEDIRRKTNVDNRLSKSKYDHVGKHSKRGGKVSYSKEEEFGNISGGSSKTSIATEIKLIKR